MDAAAALELVVVTVEDHWIWLAMALAGGLVVGWISGSPASGRRSVRQ
jgi:hypothetical protein